MNEWRFSVSSLIAALRSQASEIKIFKSFKILHRVIAAEGVHVEIRFTFD